jgi:hypothetical protein
MARRVRPVLLLGGVLAAMLAAIASGRTDTSVQSWRSSLGFRLDYPSEWAQTRATDRDLELTYTADDGLIQFLLRVAPSGQKSPLQLLDELARTLPANAAHDRSPAHALISPTIGSVDGIGAVYAGVVDTAQGPGKPFEAYALASQDRQVTAAVLVATTTPRQPGNWSGEWPELEHADELLEAMRWPSQPRVDAGGLPHPRCGFPCSGLTPAATEKAFDIGPLHAQGIRGKGQTVAVVSLGRFRDQDVRLFDRRFGLSGPPPRHVPIGAKPAETDGLSVGEANLDVETIRSVAPQATILSYETGDELFMGLAEAVNRIVADGRAKIASISLDNCDYPDVFAYYRADRKALERAFAAAAAAGVTFFVASGDGAAYPCGRENLARYGPTALYPGDSAHVVSVGGTLLTVHPDGSYAEEAGWEYPLTRLGSGGGLSPVDPRPAWQDAPGVRNAASNGRRQFPDVAGPGDFASGFFLVSFGNLFASGGTSASAPFWAGTAALLSEYAGRGLGFAAPLLYRVAREPQPFPPFHDVVQGGNLAYDAEPGWDYATGLGSPDVWNLARDLKRLPSVTSPPAR